MAGSLKWKHPKRILGYCGEWDIDHTIINERLARRGYYDISEAYKSMHGV